MSVETPVQARRTFFHASFANNSTLTKWPCPKIENSLLPAVLLPCPSSSALTGLDGVREKGERAVVSKRRREASVDPNAALLGSKRGQGQGPARACAHRPTLDPFRLHR
jgi:hypothetical protein